MKCLLTNLLVLIYLTALANFCESAVYRMHKGRKIPIHPRKPLKSFHQSGRFLLRAYENPEPLPLPINPRETKLNQLSYHSLNQGHRVDGDTLVCTEKLALPAQVINHQITFDKMYDCVINHISLDTNTGIPIMIRGGVGYRHFMIKIKAKPGKELSGLLKAYCMYPKKTPT